MPHDLTRDDVDLAQLADEIGIRLRRAVALSARMPGQRDDDGTPLPGVLMVLDAGTVEEIDVDGRTIAAAVRAHTPPTDRRQELADRASAGTLTTAERDEAMALLLGG
jgi:hypothetical protein